MMEKAPPEGKISNLEAMVTSLTELLTVQEKVVGEQSDLIRQDEIALQESNDRFLLFIREAAMRLKNPMEVVGENLALVIEEMESGDAECHDVMLQLRIQVKNLEQIRQNIIELNKAIVERSGDISEPVKKFLLE